MKITGTFTPQKTSERYTAMLLVDEPNQPSGQLLLAIDRLEPVLAPVTITHVSAMMAGADWRITLAGRGIFTLSAPDLPESLTPLLPKGARRSSFVGLAERLRWRGMIVICMLILASLIGIRAGLPAAGDYIARFIPIHWAKTAGDTTISQLDQLFLSPSKLSLADRGRIDQIFASINATSPPDAIQPKLLYRSAPSFGPNAFALPGNIVILLDEMVEFANDDDVIAGVLAHEIGHVTNRHAMRMVARSAVIAVSVGLVFGIDDSFVEEMATLGTNLILSSHSRKFEREADKVSIQILQQLGRNPTSLLKLFDKFAAECGNGCNKTSFFDSHPGLDERRALFE
ncbi:M48 family metallopeptidase [Alphaproteobacteria bacterium]|nr:M48 family metallopeptidase [Alphaproteobacteria bacterium]